MIQLHSDTPIQVAVKPADFRKGIDGFTAICQQQLASDPQTGTLFVFINRNRTMIRALQYDGTGFWLMTKRLSKGHFQGWPQSIGPVEMMQATALRSLLSFVDAVKIPDKITNIVV
jgi:transposase